MITLGSLFDGIGGFPFDNETERLEQLSLLGPTMVGENVPRAFSSKDGEDFRTVLEETTRIVDDSISVPRPPGEGGDLLGPSWKINSPSLARIGCSVMFS